MIKFAVKSGLAYGALYYTCQQGTWSNSVTTTKLYDKISNEISPHTKNLKAKLPLELPLLPSTGEVRFVLKYYYNQGVKNTIYFIHHLPCYLGQWSKKGKDAITNVLDSAGKKQSTGEITKAKT